MVILPVQAVVNVSLTMTPAVHGEGARLTCSWTNLSNVKKVEYKRLSTNEVVYTYDNASNTNAGSGILSGSVGWMETDQFIVYFALTRIRQFVTYYCQVTNDEGSNQSPSYRLDVPGKYQSTPNLNNICRIDIAVLQQMIYSVRLMSQFGFKSNQ